MDPLTHALVGGSLARVALHRPLGRAAWLPGVVGALLPDVDSLIRSSADPLLYVEYHRHFTHALAFIPVGGLIASLPWLLRARSRPQWKAYTAAATLGYATHGLLDAATTYGTQLLWPFSNLRVAWSWISIIDPIFTLALVLGVALTAWWRSPRPAAAALLFCGLYLAAGAAQRGRALEAQERIAAARGHARARGDVFPTVGNHLVWRSLYQAGDTLHVDRIRIPWSGAATWADGTALELLAEDDLPAEVLAHPRLRNDFQRFRWFSDGWIAQAPADTTIIGDVRYSVGTDGFEPIWGIRLHPAEPQPVEWVNRSRQRELGLGPLWDEIRGHDPRFLPIP